MNDYLRHWIGVVCAATLGIAAVVVVVAVSCLVLHRAFLMTPDNDYDREAQTVARVLLAIVVVLGLIIGSVWGLA